MESQSKLNKKNDFGQLIISYLPIFTLISLGIGILNQLVYYYPFHLDILTYVDLNEIILSSFTILLKCLVIALVGYISAELMSFFIKKPLKITNKYYDGIPISLKRANIFMMFFVVVFSLLLVLFYNRYNNTNYGILIKEWHLVLCTLYIIGVLGIASLLYFKYVYETNYSMPFKFKYTNIIMASIVVLYWTIFFSALDAINMSFHSSYGTYIEAGNKRVVSTLNYYYIGRTKNFVFFYDVKNDFTDIYQNKDISLLSINNKDFLETKKHIVREQQKKDSIIHKKIIDSINNRKYLLLTH
jgi:hypothetical protein